LVNPSSEKIGAPIELKFGKLEEVEAYNIETIPILKIWSSTIMSLAKSMK
jgi:hypothetical protein